MTRGIDQLESVALEDDPNVLRLDRDPPLALNIHRVEVLGTHVSGVDRTRDLEDPIRQCRLAVVDVADNRKVPDLLDFEGSGSRTRGSHDGPSVPVPARVADLVVRVADTR